jgi:hypothetical protein
MDLTVDDAARFERTFADNHPAIAAYLLRRSASREDAEDAATEVFAVASTDGPLRWLSLRAGGEAVDVTFSDLGRSQEIVAP